ncbi:MAG TPA: hypothetical protein V6C58_03610, partial [Allocoleopsis sp.]
MLTFKRNLGIKELLMTLEIKSLVLVQEALAKLEENFYSLPKFDRSVNLDAIRPILLEVAERMQ